MGVISTRYVDLRGRDIYLGRLWRSSRDYTSELEPVALMAGLSARVEENVGLSRHMNSWLSLYDADTDYVLGVVRQEAERITHTLLSGDVFESLVVLDRNWGLPCRPGRPAEMLVEDQVDSGTPDGTPGRFLHGAIFTIELCAAELCAASLALHALEVPTALLVDISKQVFDEMRHFRMLAGLLDRYDTALGDYPIDTLIWDKFLLGESLAERLVIEQRLGEGIGLDGGYSLYQRFVAASDLHAVQCFDFINADEMTHVRNGNRWIEYLTGGVEARTALDEKMRQRLAENDWRVKHNEPINVTDRSLAGFSRDEIADIRRMARNPSA
ncbi:MAG: DUF455 family protein [Sciscionella sp.]